MTNKEKEVVIREALENQDVFELKSVMKINAKPHPYMIGAKHVAYASDNRGGSLDESVCKIIPCAQPKCQTPYEEHTSDTVAFMELLRDVSNLDATEALKIVNEIIGNDLIDGYAFVKNDHEVKMIIEK